MSASKPEPYWFARRFPIGDRRSAMAPIHWKGWVAAGLFGAVMVLGCALFAVLSLQGSVFQGVIVFSVLAIVGGGWFTLVAQANGDRVRTVADYRDEKRRV